MPNNGILGRTVPLVPNSVGGTRGDVVADTAEARLGSVTKLPFALVIMSLLVAAYTYLEFVQPPEPWYSMLSLVVAFAAILLLRASGFSRRDQRLQFAPLSRAGALLLLAATALMLPILGSSTGFVGWRWLPALLYAPASGITQELFFRGSVLPVLERALPGRRAIALLCHTLVFVAWHLRTFTLLPSLPVALVVATVLSLAGIAWGRQAQRDETVVWGITQHSLFLVVMSVFDWA
jgi:membrane protease YdiL (CAAX protease family)